MFYTVDPLPSQKPAKSLACLTTTPGIVTRTQRDPEDEDDQKIANTYI